MNRTLLSRTGVPLLFFFCLTGIAAHGQVEVEPWGNITGIRMEGQLMEFESSIRVVGKDWGSVNSTGKEKQHPHYTREGKAQIVSTQIDNLNVTEVIEDQGPGMAKVKIVVKALAEARMTGVFFSIVLPIEHYGGGSLQLIDPTSVPLGQPEPSEQEEYLHATGKGITCSSRDRSLEVRFEESASIIATQGVNTIRLSCLHPCRRAAQG